MGAFLAVFFIANGLQLAWAAHTSHSGNHQHLMEVALVIQSGVFCLSMLLAQIYVARRRQKG